MTKQPMQEIEKIEWEEYTVSEYGLLLSINTNLIKIGKLLEDAVNTFAKERDGRG